MTEAPEGAAPATPLSVSVPAQASPVGFTGGASPWLAGLGGLRNTVRQELMARQVDEQIAARFPVGQRLRILDVGMGQGTQVLRLARAGHKVTGLESDPEMLAAARRELAGEPAGIRERVRVMEGDGRETGAHFLPGSFDVVLCHGVLMYVPEPDALLAALARMLAPGGLLSLLVRNADALAMRAGLGGDWAGALAAFDTDAYTNRLGLPARADRREALAATMSGIGAPLSAWYGVRVFTDGVPNESSLPVPAELSQIIAAEDRAGRTDPYRAVAALLHLCGVRG